MIRKIIIISLTLAITAFPAMAFDSSQITDNLVYQELKAYKQDFDILAMDFSLTGLSDNHLNALTVYNSRTANSNDDIAAIKFWSDDGDDIWQGYLVDNLLATGTKIDSRRWLFNDLDLALTDNNHFYVSIETKNSVTDQRKLQLEISQLIDVNGNQLYDLGDSGIFLDSVIGGPTDQAFVSNYVYTMDQRSGDILAPKVALTNLKNNQSMTASSTNNFLTITGGALDRMGGTTEFVKISIVPNGQEPVWHDVNSLTADFATWDYQVENLAGGEYDVQTYAADGDGNSLISDVINFSLAIIADEQNDNQNPPGDEDNQTGDEQTIDSPQWNGGSLFKSPEVSAVYWLQAGKIYWFLNEQLYFEYFEDFSPIETISLEQLNAYELGGSVPLKPGAMMQSVDSNKVFEVGANWQRRWIQSPEEALSLYGQGWETKVKAVPQAYLLLFAEVENL